MCHFGYLYLVALVIKCNYSFYLSRKSFYTGNLICQNLIHLSNIYLREFSLSSWALKELAEGNLFEGDSAAEK